jgi:putative pyruvate formate lyase activating enzyme
MIDLQNRGVHSIGFVSPTHFVPQIVRAVVAAIPLGLSVPLVYNTNSYDSIEVLRMLEGIIDIYLPDIKYADDDAGYRYSKVREYVRHARASITEMYRQTGPGLLVDENGTVQRGLIIRHLVLPNDLARSEESLRWISANLDPRVTMSIMSQYYPVHRAGTTELLDRRIRESEYFRVLDILDACGLANGWIQDFESQNYYRPDFNDRNEPFKGRQMNFSEGGKPYAVDVAECSEDRAEIPQRVEAGRQGNSKGI